MIDNSNMVFLWTDLKKYEGNSLDKLLTGIKSKYDIENEAYRYPYKVSVLNHDPYVDVPVSTYRDALEYASTTRALAFINICMKRTNEPRKYKLRTAITQSEYDQTLLASYFLRYFDFYELTPMLFQSGRTDWYSAAKRGTIAININLGSYSDILEMTQIEVRYGNIATAASRAIISYLWPMHSGFKNPNIDTPAVLDDPLRQPWDKVVTLPEAEAIFCIKSQGDPHAAIDENLEVPF